MTEPARVVIDACALAGTLRRHFLSVFAFEGGFVPVVSAPVLHEVRYAIPKTMKATARSDEDLLAHSDRVCELFLSVFPHAFHDITNTSTPDHKPLPDPDDEHVLTLALQVGANTIITENLKDFPVACLKPSGLQAMSTDRFLADLIETRPDLAEPAMKRLQAALSRTSADLPATLATAKRAGLRRTSKCLADLLISDKTL